MLYMYWETDSYMPFGLLLNPIAYCQYCMYIYVECNRINIFKLMTPRGRENKQRRTVLAL